MKDVQFSLGWLWFFVFFTLSLFFALAERRYRGRGFGLLGGMSLAVGIVSAADAVMSLCGESTASFFAARLALTAGLVASILHTHFLCAYFDAKRRHVFLWVGYASAGVGIVLNVVLSAVQLERLSELAFPLDYRSPSLEFSVYFLVVLLVLSGANLTILYPAMRQKRAPARGLFVALVLSAPLCIVEVYHVLDLSARWYLIEATTWAYSLIVIASLISEFQGTEGLLRQTTSNLAARTAELESSYAEINLMASELSRKQQLAAVGELAAAIAHEVRNPLAIIMNAVSAMKRATISATDRNTLLDIVNEESERLNQLVVELLRFARPVTAARSPISLHDICHRASQAAPDGYQLRVHSHVDDELGPVLVDPGLFRLALDNLIANSCQAMPDGGVIELTVRLGKFSDGTPAAAVDVRDTGSGMAPSELENARKPFFTTKPRGTGLGIPIVDKIVEAHGGEMELVSTVGLGTTVSILLPLEREFEKGGAYVERLTSNRRRLRSIPPITANEKSDTDAVLSVAAGKEETSR